MRKPNKKQIYHKTEPPKGSQYQELLEKTYGKYKAQQILKRVKNKELGFASAQFMKKIRAYKPEITQEFN